MRYNHMIAGSTSDVLSPNEGIEALDPESPIVLVSAAIEGLDRTEFLPSMREMFCVRQIDAEGICHTLLLSEAMVLELMKYMKSWIGLG